MVLDVLVAVGGDRDHVRAARAHLLDVRDELVVDVDVRRDDDDGRVLVEQRDRPVLHLAGGVRLGRDVADLLQLQRALERDREADVPAEVEEERPVGEPLGDLLDRMVAVEEALDLVGQLVDRVEDELALLCRHRPPHLRQLQRDEVEQRDLRRERLRRRDADLEPAACVQHGIDLARDLRAHHVRDRDGVGALLARELHRLDRVAGLAGLGDADHERVVADHRIAVDPLGGDVRLDGEPRPLLEHVAADDARVVGRAAREDDDAAQVAQLLVGHAEPLEHERAVTNAVADRLGHGLRLLVDLLQHERLVAALLGALVVPVELDRVVLDRCAVGAREDGAGRGHLDDVAVVRELDDAGLA